ncbi:hypothetical protein F443_22388 [Phytophthora nicotianae P1569]|uniref:Uncharacterized protein n=1 Tax=Phytophthora nicotianae P1569 TaxID=1317065 RepID=V9DUF6_PHYNI|nr:hypothetical protein F443_22388 [Phytophthora nicotianae P1569]
MGQIQASAESVPVAGAPDPTPQSLATQHPASVTNPAYSVMASQQMYQGTG